MADINTPAVYSPYFSTLHDEQAPVGNIGRGCHYSVLQCAEWFDVMNQPVKEAQLHRFGIIWDEDHDERIILVIERMYLEGLLAPVQFIGERKAFLTVIVAAKFFYGWQPEEIEAYKTKIEKIASNVDWDHWQVDLGYFDRTDPLNVGYYAQTELEGIIADQEYNVQTYLRNIDNLWSLGTTDHKAASSSYRNPNMPVPPAEAVPPVITRNPQP
ncbi:hypothetical protein [Oceanobacter mangrovi]|uniref:hypothetical protein n=1 Tax=Oceanobacter mangrovi TaxID=2862510 RepID=UPI001C8D274C|nr:hypothetical protein [Oceanobacter mangrovi]